MSLSKKLAATVVAGAAVAAGALPASAAPESRAQAIIRYTEYGIPHIVAHDFTGLGQGYGYASAKDNICVLADTYISVNAQRSRYFGASAPVNTGVANASNSLNSDLYFQRIIDSGTVERLVQQTPLHDEV